MLVVGVLGVPRSSLSLSLAADWVPLERLESIGTPTRNALGEETIIGECRVETDTVLSDRTMVARGVPADRLLSGEDGCV